MKRIVAALTAFWLVAISPHLCRAADSPRQDVVRERGADVMPFQMEATTHIFTKTPIGGVQRVVAKDANDEEQIELIRAHLKEIAHSFSRGDFSAPTHVHGAAMPGLATLQSAGAGALTIRYDDVKAGAEIHYSSGNPKIVGALHEWFDAQLTDHGPDAMQGHDHSMMYHDQ
jgi:hypothetical protein